MRLDLGLNLISKITVTAFALYGSLVLLQWAANINQNPETGVQQHHDDTPCKSETCDLDNSQVTNDEDDRTVKEKGSHGVSDKDNLSGNDVASPNGDNENCRTGKDVEGRRINDDDNRDSGDYHLEDLYYDDEHDISNSSNNEAAGFALGYEPDMNNNPTARSAARYEPDMNNNPTARSAARYEPDMNNNPTARSAARYDPDMNNNPTAARYEPKPCNPAVVLIMEPGSAPRYEPDTNSTAARSAARYEPDTNSTAARSAARYEPEPCNPAAVITMEAIAYRLTRMYRAMNEEGNTYYVPEEVKEAAYQFLNNFDIVAQDFYNENNYDVRSFLITAALQYFVHTRNVYPNRLH